MKRTGSQEQQFMADKRKNLKPTLKNRVSEIAENESKNFIEKAEVLQLTEDSSLLLNVNKKIEEIKNQEIFEKCRQDFLINKYFK